MIVSKLEEEGLLVSCGSFSEVTKAHGEEKKKAPMLFTRNYEKKYFLVRLGVLPRAIESF